jgi:hypothetical protein
MFTLEPNENFDEELRRIREKNSDKDVPHQQVPTDTIFYYELKTITIIILDSPFGTTESMSTSVVTFYSSDEGILTAHRQSEINNRSGNNAFPPTIYPSGEVKVIRPAGNSRVEFYFSVIQSEQRPPRIPRPRGPTSVETLQGTFLENKTGTRRR